MCTGLNRPDTDDQTAAGPHPARIRELFSAVAPTYDILNDLLSFGLHRKWRQQAVALAMLKPGGRALDVCTGTGDLARVLAERVGPSGVVIGVDFCEPMLRLAVHKLARTKSTGRGACTPVLVLADALALPFPDDTFDAATVGFGMRNVQNIHQAFFEMARVVRPGGRVVCLELAQPRGRFLPALYHVYFRGILPRIGQLVHGRLENYAYLPSSLDRFPDRAKLAGIMRDAGLREVRVLDLTGGIVAIHYGIVEGGR
ncbi:MAG: bifunctional demethylmenaquinone methyltransferase/2-methoxy-6-polyprenyl-1,4-benzoquinol methylase UbiE [Armatimonadota bacterium]